ncbi:hypothetical protein Tco_0084208 [Tanacetum coccineum]
MSRKRVITIDKDNEFIDNTKYRGMIGSLLYLTASRPDIMFSFYLYMRFQEDPKIMIMSNSKEFVNEGEMEESSKKSKRKVETVKGYEGDERMESREMLLSINHSLKMLLDIISKMNRKLEDENIKMNDKGKGKVNDFLKIRT